MLRGDEEFPSWTSRRSWVLKVFLFNQMINVPLDGTYNHGWREDWFRRFGFRICLMKTGEGIGSIVLRARTVSDLEVESREEQGPSGLAMIQSLSFTEVFQVPVVCYYLERELGSLQPMTPFFQSQLDGQ